MATRSSYGSIAISTAAVAALVLLAGCESAGIDVKESNAGRVDNYGRHLKPHEPDAKTLGGGDLFNFGGGDSEGAQLPVNKYLWRASLDTLSFLPLASTDPHGGVIVTDWGASPDAPGERFKVTAYITSAELSPKSLRVVVNRQVKRSGSWVDAAVSKDTVRKLENAILTRARVVRSGDRED